MHIKMVKVKFEVAGPDQIAEWLFYNFKQAIIGNLEGVSGQLIFIELSEEIKDKIRLNVDLTEELKESLITEIKNTAPKNLELLKEKVDQKWKEDGEKIIKEIERLTEKKFYQEEITCFINHVVCSSYLDKDIILGFKEIPQEINKIHDFILLIIGEELLHLHYVTILHKMPELANKKFNEFKEWQVLEVLPEFILFENKNLNYLNKEPEQVRKRSESYPWLDEVKEEIRAFWKDRKSFRDFILNVYKEYNSC